MNEKVTVTAGSTARVLNDTANVSEDSAGWSFSEVILGSDAESQRDKISNLNKRLRGVVRVGHASSSR